MEEVGTSRVREKEREEGRGGEEGGEKAEGGEEKRGRVRVREEGNGGKWREKDEEGEIGIDSTQVHCLTCIW